MTLLSYDAFRRAVFDPPKPAWPYRDVCLLDLARYAAAKTPFDLDTMQADTDALHEALKAEADRLGAGPDADPEPAMDALEPFALAWARDRAAARTTTLNAGA